MNSSYYETLVDAVLSLKTKKDVRGFLDGILTPKEREELALRLQIIRLLKKDIPQHEIAKRLGVGIATVTRGSKELSKGNFANWR